MKICKFLIVALLSIFCFSVNDVEAVSPTNFEIKANFSWGHDSKLRYAIKVGSNKYSVVQWNQSNQSSHKMWFRILDTSNKERGKAIFTYVDTDAFQTNLTAGQEYYLQARREFILDPLTIVKGSWLA